MFGENEQHGRDQANLLSEGDRDSYHDWVLYKFNDGSDPAGYDPVHEKIYSTRRIEA